MNRKRLWIWAVLACLLVGILAACDPTDPPSVEETSGITEVTSVSEEAPTDPETDPETLPASESDTEPAPDTEPESDTESAPDTELESDTETEPGTNPADSETAEPEPPETDAIPCAHASWGEKTEVVAPTCTAEGYYSHACKQCGYTETVTVEALGHTEVVDAGKAATCTQTGISVGKHCSVCGVITVEQTRIPAKGHTEAPVWGKDPTCTVPGLTDGKACSVCGVVTVTQTEIPATGHTEVVDRAVAATCTAAGKSEGKHCSVCGTVTVPQKEISAKGHKATVLPAVKATCTRGGLTEGAQCSVCGVITVEQTVLPAKGHTEVLDAARAPTCTKTGLTQGSHCTVCGQVAVAQTILPAKGHTETVVVGKPATCTQNGVTDGKKCSACGEILIAQTVLLSPGHKAVTDPGYEATCATTGLTDGSHCEVCEVILVAQEKILSPYHVFEDGKCVDCGCDRFSQGIAYTLNSDQKGYTVSGMGTCTDTELIIPATYQDLPVTAIKASAFADCGVVSVVVPDSVTSIGSGAFQGCNNLEEITLPFIGNTIGATEYTGVFGYIFGYVTGNSAETKTSQGTGYTYQGYLSGYYRNYYIPETLRKVTITLDTTIPQGAFRNCDLIEEISLPDGIESIGQYAFYNCTALETVDAGLDTIQTISSYAFTNCTSLIRIGDVEKVIELPETLRNVGSYAFQNCVNFEVLRLDLVGGINDYAFDGCTNIKEVTFGDQITSIGSNAFGNCPVTELIIPDGVTSIGGGAFQNWLITEVVVPDSVTSIGSGAFRGCNNLVEITLPFIGRTMGATGYEGVFGHVFGYVNGNSAETKTSQGMGYTYQGYFSGNYRNYYIPETLRKVTVTLDTTIPEGAFRNCDLIEEIMLPDGIESINQYAFYNCTALKTVDAGVDAIQTISSYAFTNCVSLIRIGDVEKVIELPETLQNLGSYAFQNCVNFEVLRLDLVGGIYDYAFDGCTNVKEVTFGDQITSIGSNAFRNCPVTELIIPNGVTSIGGGAFQNWLITEVVVPDSVKSIGNGAFQGCNNLVEITLPFIGRAIGATGYEGVFGHIFGYVYGNSAETKTSQGMGYTYQGYFSGNYRNYYIPETLRKVTVTLDTTIPEGAFRNCDLIEEISLPDVSEQIDSYAFYNCTSLKTLQIRDSAPVPMLKKAPASFFAADTDTGDTLQRIGDYAFYNCSAMPFFDEDISGLTYLGQYAFYNCTSLTRVGKTDKVIELSETLTNIGRYAFYNCGQFETLILNLKGSIGDGAFDQCTSVTSVTIGQNVTYIGNYAFRLCQAADLSLPMGLTHIGNEAFKGWLMNRVTVPDSVTYIGYGAFSGCGNIEQMTIPFVGSEDTDNNPFGYIFGSVSASGSALTSQGLGYTYQGRNYEIPQVLRRVTVTRGTKISNYAFYNCDLLEVIALPGTVQSIGSSALANCFDLTHLYFGGSQSDWRDISFGSGWKSGSDYYYLHMYADEYGVYIPTGAIHLQVASDNSFILLPLDGTVEAMAYRVRTHEIVPLDVANMHLEIVRNNCQLSITGGDTVDTPNGGVATLRVMRKMGQYDVIMNGDLGVFVAECARYKAASVPTFSLEEKQYIVFCVDFVMSMNDTSDPYTEIDFEFKYHEQLLYNASHITQYISGLLQGDTRNTTVCKQILAKFIQSYVDADYAHMKAVSATETLMAGFESANELVKKYKTFNKFKKAFNVTQEGWEALVELKELHELYLLRGITVDELTKVGNLLSQLEKYGGMDDAFRSAQRWRDYTEKTRKTFDSLIDAANRLDKALGIELITDYNQKGPDLIEVLAGGGTITHFKDIQPGWDDAVNIGLEAIIYMLHDYSYNIEVLESIKTGFKKNGLEDSLGYTAVEEMIWEYNHKEISCAQDIIMRFGAITIVKIAKKNPVVSLVLFGADILKVLNPVNEKKVEFLILDTYRTPLARCTWPAKDLYHNGVITMDLEELKTLTCIYLHLMKEYNELAIYITTRESTDEEYIEDAYALNHNISKIESLLQTYY